jgi:hypothetical protein
MNRVQSLICGVAVACCAVVLTTDASVSTASGSGCDKAGTTTIESTRDVRVYYRGTLGQHRVYACLERTGRSRRLGSFDSSQGPGINNTIIAGRFVAYQNLDCENDCAASQIRVIDLGTGKIKRSAAEGPHALRLDGLVLRPNGSVAWIRAFDDGTSQVRKLDAGGEAVLDSGSIEAGSLALGSSRLYWTKAGAPMSATLN